MRHNQGTMLVSDTERVQLARQRHQANEQRLRELRAQRDKITCARKRRCHVFPPLSEPCDACRESGWLLFLLLLQRHRPRAAVRLDRARGVPAALGPHQWC